MGVLTDIPDNRIHTGKGWLVINPAFDTVLEIQKLYKEEGLTEYEKTGQALYMLVKNRWNLRLFGPAEKSRLLEEVYRKFIAVKQRPKIRQSPFPILDFEEDGDYIYASFMQDYGIDLIEEQGRLHWKRFIALFQGLSDETKIRQVMHIRGMEIPAPTKYNQKEIQNIMELKSYYALPVSGGGGQEGLDRLFKTLEGMAG